MTTSLFIFYMYTNRKAICQLKLNVIFRVSFLYNLRMNVTLNVDIRSTQWEKCESASRAYFPVDILV